MQYTTVQNAKHTVCNTLRYRMPSILYAIHYGPECQAYCMQYTTVQNAKHTVCNTLRYLHRSVLHTVCLVFCTIVYCLICLVFCNVVFSYSMLGILYRSVLHTVCLVFCTVVYFIIHYGTEYQAYCMKYTTVQNAKHTV
jgi:hypothetical protein